jgi:hypothetical protein
MLYGTPPRAAHRANAGGGTALLVKAVGATGQHRHPSPTLRTRPVRRQARSPRPVPPRPVPARRRAPKQPHRAAHLLTKGLAALIVLGVTGMICFLIVADARRVPSAEAGTSAGGERLVSRSVDPAPLTLPEVFPDTGLVQPAGYRIRMSNIDTRCRTATTGALGPVLEQHGCSQVVRAGLTAPYGDYQVTAGLFNLEDAAGASRVDDQVRRLVETDDGSFAMLGTEAPGTEPAAPATAQVGWQASGHYLVYCVITRPDGELVTADDPNAARITADLVDGYLAGSVLGHRKPTH